MKAIKDYGIRAGEKAKRGEQDLPKYGLHERIESVDVKGEKRIRAYGCVLAKEWRECGEDSLGRLYCYIDPAKTMSVDPTKKLVHTKAIPDGDNYCELVFRPTTEKERKKRFRRQRSRLGVYRQDQRIAHNTLTRAKLLSPKAF